jgi:hypothetical protein
VPFEVVGKVDQQLLPLPFQGCGSVPDVFDRATEIAHEKFDESFRVTGGFGSDVPGVLLNRSKLSAGCAVLAVTVAAGDDELLDHAGTIFRTWTDHLAALFTAGGIRKPSARELATTVIAATEGAVALCRAQRSREPFDHVAATLARLAKT